MAGYLCAVFVTSPYFVTAQQRPMSITISMRFAQAGKCR